MDVNLGIKLIQSQNYGRNMGLYNDLVRETLFFVCQSRVSLSPGRIAQHIRQDESRYMSNEYKIIRRLCPNPQSTDQFTKNPQTTRYLDIIVGEDGRDTYVPNFRGFLAYLYNEYLVMKRPRVVNGNVRFNVKIAKRIRKVISNPLIIKIAPFLGYWEVFERHGFDVVGLLTRLSVELHYQLHIDAEDDNYLLRRAAERYYVELENYFYQYIDLMGFFTIKKIGLKSYRLICETRTNYRKMMTNRLKEWVDKQLDRINFLNQEGVKSEMFRELDALAAVGATKIISISQLVRKYGITNYLSAIDTVKNRESLYKKYLVAESFLISKPLVEEVRKLVSDKMRYPDVAVIFKHHNIPKECIFDIMKKLGYNEERGKLVNDDFETGRHIIFIKV
jgi:hypothetical protein